MEAEGCCRHGSGLSTSIKLWSYLPLSQGGQAITLQTLIDTDCPQGVGTTLGLEAPL